MGFVITTRRHQIFADMQLVLISALQLYNFSLQPDPVEMFICISP